MLLCFDSPQYQVLMLVPRKTLLIFLIKFAKVLSIFHIFNITQSIFFVGEHEQDLQLSYAPL